MRKPEQIDVVYTWVDGESPVYWDQIRRYSRDVADANPERYRDIYSLLKYSLRSLEKFAPWLGRVYLVTCRPQTPRWLNTAHPRLSLIHHDEIFDPVYLPTFNCNAIESYLHLVPNPSPYLLYFNDDYLLGNRTAVSDFFTAGGRMKLYGTLLGEHFHHRIYETLPDGIYLGFVEHVPLLIHKPLWRRMLASEPVRLHRTRKSRFRRGRDLRMERLWRYFLLARCRPQVSVVPFYRAARSVRFHKITNQRTFQARSLRRLEQMRPKFYCLNDDQRACPDAVVASMVLEMLERWYPEKSAFEL